MDPTALERLLQQDETDRVEKTRSATDTDKFGEAICAFANDLPGARQPGYLFVGALPDGSPSGLVVTDQLLQNLAALRADGNLIPPPSMVVQRMSLNGGDMAVVEVQPSDHGPVCYKGRIWIRVGPRRGLASADDERVLLERRQARAGTWDMQTCAGSSLDDLALDLFTLHYRARAVDRRVIDENHRPMERQLAALRLFNTREPAGPTNAGVLLLGIDPLGFVPGAYVQFVRYGGTSKLDVIGERRVSGDLLTVLRGLDEIVASLVRERPVRDPLAERVVFDWPPVALHELLVNAVIHRSYLSTAPVQISAFEDRVEVLSPGGLYGMTLEDFPGGTGYRNPTLAEAARVLGFANRFDRGIDASNAALRANGSPDVAFDVRQSYFLATVWKRP